MLVTSTAERNRITRRRFASKHSRSSYSNKLAGRLDRSRLGMRNFRGICILEVCGETFFPEEKSYSCKSLRSPGNPAISKRSLLCLVRPFSSFLLSSSAVSPTIPDAVDVRLLDFYVSSCAKSFFLFVRK